MGDKLTEKGLRGVFSVEPYITIGTKDDPLEYGIKPAARSVYDGKQFMTTPAKEGRLPDAYFDKAHPWISDGDPFEDRLLYQTLQAEKKRAFGTGDFRRRDEYTKTVRVEQYREQLKKEARLAKLMLAQQQQANSDSNNTHTLFDSTHNKEPSRFEGPKYLYDVGREGGARTEVCLKCHSETFYCPHRASYGNHNLGVAKRDGGYRTSSADIGFNALSTAYAKPHYARKPVIKETFFRRTNAILPSNVRHNQNLD
eukprot:jgi/Chlat1/4259/Chrsp279S00811